MLKTKDSAVHVGLSPPLVLLKVSARLVVTLKISLSHNWSIVQAAMEIRPAMVV